MNPNRFRFSVEASSFIPLSARSAHLSAEAKAFIPVHSHAQSATARVFPHRSCNELQKPRYIRKPQPSRSVEDLSKPKHVYTTEFLLSSREQPWSFSVEEIPKQYLNAEKKKKKKKTKKRPFDSEQGHQLLAGGTRTELSTISNGFLGFKHSRESIEQVAELVWEKGKAEGSFCAELCRALVDKMRSNKELKAVFKNKLAVLVQGGGSSLQFVSGLFCEKLLGHEILFSILDELKARDLDEFLWIYRQNVGFLTDCDRKRTVAYVKDIDSLRAEIALIDPVPRQRWNKRLLAEERAKIAALLGAGEHLEEIGGLLAANPQKRAGFIREVLRSSPRAVDVVGALLGRGLITAEVVQEAVCLKGRVHPEYEQMQELVKPLRISH